MKRLHGQKDDTAVFSGSLAGVRNAAEAGFRTVAVRGCAGEDEWREMQSLAAQSLSGYGELLG